MDERPLFFGVSAASPRAMTSRSAAWLLLGLLASTPACKRRPPPAEPAAKVEAAEKPRLVLNVVFDQMSAWALERYLPALSDSGFIKRALAEGAYVERAQYPYGVTITAVGHATINTGVLPKEHGVVSNDQYDPVRGQKRALVDDGEHQVFGTEGFAGPGVLKVDTVGDVLAQTTEGLNVSISLKDRGSVLPGGKKADFVAFYEKKIPGFTTSSYYADEMPKWLAEWNAAHPASDYFDVWTPLEVTARVAGVPDDRGPIEGDLDGFGRVFPHDPKATSNPASIIRLMPNGTRYQLDLVRAAVEALELGQDEATDLLSVSVSSTDYTGHAFGAESWEYLDNLVRSDEMLGQLVRELERKTKLAVLLTSDHGQEPTSAKPLSARIFPEKLVEELNRKLRRKLGKGQHVTGYHIPYLYLSPELLGRPKIDAIIETIIGLLEARPDVAAAYPTQAIASADEAQLAEMAGKLDVELLEAIARGVDPERGGPIYVLPAEGAIVDASSGDGGTTHGTPYAYDREVPVLGLGVGVSHVRTATASMLQVAPSLARLLGISPPAGAKAAPLPGFDGVN